MPRVPPNVVGQPCRQATATLREAGWFCQCVPPFGVSDPVTRQDPPLQTPDGAVVKVYFDVSVPSVIGDLLPVAGDQVRNARLIVTAVQPASPGSGSPGTVADQNPKPGTLVAPGSGVTLFVVPDRLTLTPTGSTSAQVLAPITVEAALEPARPGTLYTFDWGDGHPRTGPSPDPKAVHRYLDARSYSITAIATDSSGEMEVRSEPLQVEVKPYSVSLAVVSGQPARGQPITLRARLDPGPPEPARALRYRFTFDGNPGRWQPQPEITQTFDATGDHRVSVTVMFGKEEIASADTVITIPRPTQPVPPWVWLAGGVVLVGFTGLTLRYAVRKGRVKGLREQILVSTTLDAGRQTVPRPSPTRPPDPVLVRAFPATGAQQILVMKKGGHA